MEYILAAIFIYSIITSFLMGRFTESIRLTEGVMSIPQWLGCILVSVIWPFTLIWYIYDRISNRRHS